MIKIEISQNHTQFFAQLNSLYSSKMSSRITLLYDIWVEREGGSVILRHVVCSFERDWWRQPVSVWPGGFSPDPSVRFPRLAAKSKGAIARRRQQSCEGKPHIYLSGAAT